MIFLKFIKFHGIPWNSMELHKKFHGIPWKSFSSKFWNLNSTEFCTILKLSVLMIPMVPLDNKIRSRGIPWNGHQQFHGIPWNFECTSSMTRAVPWNSMELGVRQFRWHEQFHGIPWNSMELRVHQFHWHEQFHGIPWNWVCANFANTSSSMEFHGTSSPPISLTRTVPWNLECANFDDGAVPWNSMQAEKRDF